MRLRTFTAMCLAACLCVAGWLAADDWPQWRHDAGRTAATPEELPSELSLLWERTLPPPRAAYARYPRLAFDAAYEPVVLGTKIFVPSMVTDSVTALDTATGDVGWTYVAGGPVRFAPVAWEDKLYFVCDDGYLYCLRAASGELLWKVRGLPADHADRKVLGNDRLISLWPARGGPVLAGGVLYFAAGVWPFEGVYVRAVDARTGKAIWTNNSAGWIPKAHLDHNTLRDGGISPQGYLAIVAGRLLVPSGRALPGSFDPATGKLGPYSTRWGGRQNLQKGCWYVAGTGKYAFLSGDVYQASPLKRIQIDPADQKELGDFREPVLAGDTVYFSKPVNVLRGYRPRGSGYDRVVAWNVAKPPVFRTLKDAQKRTFHVAEFEKRWEMPSTLKVHIRAGSRLYAAGKDLVAAIDLPASGKAPAVSWKAPLRGTPARLLAADGKLFAVTREGGLFAFGGEAPDNPRRHAPAAGALPAAAGMAAQVAAKVLDAEDPPQGYAIVCGAGSGSLPVELARRSQLHVIVLERDADKVRELRRRLLRAGLYGTRIAVVEGDPLSLPLPPYLATIVTSEEPVPAAILSDSRLPEKVFNLLRPYTGKAIFRMDSGGGDTAGKPLEACKFDSARTEVSGGFLVVTRTAPPSGAADWTHESFDAGASLVSRDRLVKPPFGVLWFGGTVDEIYPDWDFTHSRAPTPLVCTGRMFLQVFPRLHAVDIYTGRKLWSVTMRGVGDNPAPRNLPYAATADSVYVAAGGDCTRYDARDGRVLGAFAAPERGSGWKKICISGKLFLGLSGNLLVCADRIDGTPRWNYKARERVADFAVGSGTVFVADAALVDRRGKVIEPRGDLVALRLDDGKETWKTKMDLSGPPRPPLRVVYSEANDVLVTAYGVTTAFHGRDGERLWGGKALEGMNQPMLHPSRLITQNGEMYDPLTGERLPGQLWRGKPNSNWDAGGVRGCNRGIASEYLALIRDGHASYYDLASCRQTLFRGVRAGCTNSLVPGDGILNGPNFSHGCSCNYSVFASLAWIHIPDPRGGMDE